MSGSETYLEAFAEVGVLCLGDVMLDRFVYGRVARVSQEAPIPILRSERRQTMLGGAGNVGRNIQALAGRAVLIGLVGDDAAAGELRDLADGTEGLDLALVVDPARPTTLKTRYGAAGQQLIRIDEESTAPANPAAVEALLTRFATALPDCDVVIISDYAKGCLTDAVLRFAIEQATAAGKPVLVDPKRADLGAYAGATVLKPNRAELAAATGLTCDSDEEIVTAARQLLDNLDVAAVLASRSEQGLSLIPRDGAPLHLPAFARQVYDVSGAGDTVVATAAIALGAGADLATATELASHAGSNCRRQGGHRRGDPGRTGGRAEAGGFLQCRGHGDGPAGGTGQGATLARRWLQGRLHQRLLRSAASGPCRPAGRRQGPLRPADRRHQ